MTGDMMRPFTVIPTPFGIRFRGAHWNRWPLNDTLFTRAGIKALKLYTYALVYSCFYENQANLSPEKIRPVMPI